jgi:hypothetical protein
VTASRYYHGGKAGLEAGDRLVPAPAHVEDGCPICEAKKVGRVCTVGEYRRWLRQFGAKAAPVLAKLASAPDHEVIDPPRAQADAVYITSSVEYATWYAARSRGDLYQVEPIGPAQETAEDSFPSWTCREARVVRVLRRAVVLTRTERRRIEHLWRKADRRRRSRLQGAA